MTTLTISMEYHPHRPYWGYVPVPVEIINSDMEVAQELVVYGQGGVEVQPGFYLVRASLPSGEVSSAHTTIHPGQLSAQVVIQTSNSPHEWLAWQHFLGEVPPVEPGRVAPAFPAFWLRCWAYAGNNWQVLSSATWLGFHPPADPNFSIYEVRPWEGEHPALRMVQIGGGDLPWRLLSLPPTDQLVEILLRRSRTPTGLNGGLVVKVASQDKEAESLSHYLRSGSYGSAEKIGGQVLQRVEGADAGALEFANSMPVDQAEHMLRDKLRNPYGAVIGGYYLVKTGAHESLHNWPNNFANWFKWLPDAAIIHAWQLFGQSGMAELETARGRLLQAVRAGRPIFTEGMRYLIDGLELCRNHVRQAGRIDEDVENALRSSRRYAGAMDWNQRLVTFYGADPASPSLEPVTGDPDDPAGATLVRNS